MPARMVHTTLTTGHAVRQCRKAVGETTIWVVFDLLDVVLQGGHSDVPGCAGYVVDGQHHGRDLPRS